MCAKQVLDNRGIQNLLICEYINRNAAVGVLVLLCFREKAFTKSKLTSHFVNALYFSLKKPSVIIYS